MSPTFTTDQFARPNADIEQDSWTASEVGSPLYAMIDEQGVPDDADWIRSPQCDGSYVMSLRQGTTLIASRTITAEPGVFQTYIFTLTGIERELITEWGELSIWFTVNGVDTAKLQLSHIFRPDEGPITMYVRSRVINS